MPAVTIILPEYCKRRIILFIDKSPRYNKKLSPNVFENSLSEDILTKMTNFEKKTRTEIALKFPITEN